MKTRCYNQNTRKYPRYGGRGIVVCERWLGINGFQCFLVDMGLRPSPLYSIDRIDNDGDYEHANCRWATLLEQAQNKSNSRTITSQGVTLTVAEWSRRTGIGRDTIAARIDILGWSTDDAVSIDSRDKDKSNRRWLEPIEFNGKKLTIQEWSAETGISVAAIRSRLYRRNWPVSLALTVKNHGRRPRIMSA